MAAKETPVTLAQSLPSFDAETVVTLGLASVIIAGIMLALRVRSWIDDGNSNLASRLRIEWTEALGPVRDNVQSNKSAIHMLERKQQETEKTQLREFVHVDRFNALEARIDNSIQRIENALSDSRRERDAKLDKITDQLNSVLLRVTDSHARGSHD